MYHAIFLLFLSQINIIFAQFQSPCPNLFSYDNIGAEEWSGTIRVTLETELSGIWMRTVFDRPFPDLTTNFGEAVQREPNEFLIKRPSPKNDAGTTLEIKVTAKNNPTLGAAQLLGFRLNGKTVCPESGEIPPPPPPESLVPSGNSLQSPCPALFAYEPLGVDANRWYGQVTVRADIDLSGVWMRFVLDRPPIDFGTEFGTAEQKEISEFLVKKPGNKVAAGETLQYRVYADFIPGEIPPKILGFRLNARTVCPENGIIAKPEAVLPESPCPAIFQYEPRGTEKNIWHGNINVGTDSDLSGIWMRVIFDKPVTELGTSFGEVQRRGDGDFLVRNPQHALKVGENLQLRISPQFNPNDTPPKLIEIRLNARTACPENGLVATTPSLAQQLISPCSEIFTYESPGSETDRWYGNINLSNSKELNGIWLEIILDRQSIQLGFVSPQNWFGEVNSKDNVVYVVQRRDYKLSPGNSVAIRFFIRYNSAEPIPKLKNLRLNGQTICPAANIIQNSVGITTQQSNNQWATTQRPSGGLPFPKPDWVGGAWKPPVSQSSGGECGVVATVPVPLLSGGITTEAGKWPWHGALYYTAGQSPQYFCGAVLISLTHVITAAHCVTAQGTTTVLNAQDIQVFLGKYLYSQSNSGVQYMQIRRIIIHPEYNSNTFANDIALIHLTRAAQYTVHVRPACLWAGSTELSSVEGKDGTVVGWGYDNTGQVTDKLLKAVMPVVSHKKCIWSNKQFYNRVLNNGNFCAGFRNGTSVCTGDSGGGLVFPTPDSRWHVRGIVSLSVALQDTDKACDTSHYVVFTDVAKFLTWIEQAKNSG